MSSTDPSSPSLTDDRKPAYGWGRLVIAAFWAAGIAATGVALWKLLSEPGWPVGSRLVALLAGLLYLGAAIGLTHNGRRMRNVAWVCLSLSLGGPLIQGLLWLGEPPSPVWSPWARFGEQVWFTSLVLPVVGLVWMWWSNPRRIVEIAEGISRPR